MSWQVNIPYFKIIIIALYTWTLNIFTEDRTIQLLGPFIIFINYTFFFLQNDNNWHCFTSLWTMFLVFSVILFTSLSSCNSIKGSSLICQFLKVNWENISLIPSHYLKKCPQKWCHFELGTVQYVWTHIKNYSFLQHHDSYRYFK